MTLGTGNHFTLALSPASRASRSAFAVQLRLQGATTVLLILEKPRNA